ncbi:hypothetical protein [Streptomyces hygroscopicus]|uniref:hypothetical protein n=1 Tax=Streptomyces hygroscopicus TaxID=1912 RepID=UPI0037B43812
MSARDKLLAEYGRADTAPLGTLAELRQKLDAIRTEALAEAKAEVVAWLGKKSREYRATGKRQREADAVSTMASKIDRGAVRLFLDEAGKVTRDAGEITQPASGPITVYRARRVVGDRGATLGHYRTREQAQARCIAALRDERPTLVPDVICSWLGVDGTEVLSVSTPAEPRPDVTDYVVTEITVEGDEAAQPADFFQPGRTYAYGQNGYRAPELTVLFQVEHVTRHPERGHLRAIGWSKTGEPGAKWRGDFRDEGEFEGWTAIVGDSDAVQGEPAQPAELMIYRASHESIVMGYYTTRAAAQAHCEAKVQQEEPAGSIRHLSWSADDVGDQAEYELHITPADTGDLIRGTGYVVTPLTVASEYDEEADE